MPFSVPGAHLSDYTIGYIAERGWLLRARCDCGHVVEWAAAELPTLRQTMTVGELAERLKCTACGKREGKLQQLDDVSARHVGLRAKLAAEREKPPAS